jgi:divalent metal cation (Fe/Co/Zn/Cd) transporter|tara:strand:- start:150 stop:761 length:612 start_codon:yes stop_codon:yes gene_type:complete
MKKTQKDQLHKKALILSYVTVGYNVLEGTASILSGVFAGSIALIGFGLDSFIESLSGGVMIWRFSQGTQISQEEEERIEKKATRLVAYTFFILGAYVLYESIKKLVVSEIPVPSLIGIIIAVVSLVLMPILYFVKIKTASALGSSSLIADAKETLACTLLSAALLVGLGLNYLAGIWQADPIVGVIIVVFLFREGYEILNEND